MEWQWQTKGMGGEGNEGLLPKEEAWTQLVLPLRHSLGRASELIYSLSVSLLPFLFHLITVSLILSILFTQTAPPSSYTSLSPLPVLLRTLNGNHESGKKHSHTSACAIIHHT